MKRRREKRRRWNSKSDERKITLITTATITEIFCRGRCSHRYRGIAQNLESQQHRGRHSFSRTDDKRGAPYGEDGRNLWKWNPAEVNSIRHGVLVRSTYRSKERLRTNERNVTGWKMALLRHDSSSSLSEILDFLCVTGLRIRKSIEDEDSVDRTRDESRRIAVDRVVVPSAKKERVNS